MITHATIMFKDPIAKILRDKGFGTFDSAIPESFSRDLANNGLSDTRSYLFWSYTKYPHGGPIYWPLEKRLFEDEISRLEILTGPEPVITENWLKLAEIDGITEMTVSLSYRALNGLSVNFDDYKEAIQTLKTLKDVKERLAASWPLVKRMYNNC